MAGSGNDERHIAVFIDLENVAIGVREAKLHPLQIDKILDRIVERGKISVKKAYADWDGYNSYKRSFHECGIDDNGLVVSKPFECIFILEAG